MDVVVPGLKRMEVLTTKDAHTEWRPYSITHVTAQPLQPCIVRRRVNCCAAPAEYKRLHSCNRVALAVCQVAFVAILKRCLPARSPTNRRSSQNPLKSRVFSDDNSDKKIYDIKLPGISSFSDMPISLFDHFAQIGSVRDKQTHWTVHRAYTWKNTMQCFAAISAWNYSWIPAIQQ